MKRILFALLITATTTQVFGQKHELGVFLGGANGITDVGRTDYINPFPRKYKEATPALPLVMGLIYRHNLNPQMGLRLNLDYGRLIGNDLLAVEDYRYTRGAKYSNNIYEASVVFEYNFFPINSEQETAHSPYIFAGLGVFGRDHLNYTLTHRFNTDTDGVQVSPTSPTDFTTEIASDSEINFDFTIPFGVGYKYKFKYNWIIGVEVGFRPTSSDNLDHAFAQPDDFTFEVEPGLEASQSGVAEEIARRNAAAISARQLGDYSNPDWYVFTGLHLTYTFGRPPCYCD